MLFQEMATFGRPKQLTLKKHSGWGGKRKGAGRKPKGTQPLVTHTRRQDLPARFPLHVTLRMLPHVWNLRSNRSFTVLRRATRRLATLVRSRRLADPRHGV